MMLAIIAVQGVQGVLGVQDACAGYKLMHGVACAGCAGVNPLARVRGYARRLFLTFQMSFTPCTACTHCTRLNNQDVMYFLACTLACTRFFTLHKLNMSNVMDKKRQQWEIIKDQAPDLADWLLEVNKAFGKPAGMVVQLGNGEIIESGAVSQALGLHIDKVKK